MKILYVSTYINDDSYFEDMRNKYIDNEYIFTKKNLFTKLIVGFGYYVFSPILYLLYGNWKKKIKNYDMLILDSRRAFKFAVIFLKKYKIRKIVWYWNKVTKEELNPDFCKKHGFEVWSFDKSDCEKYDMHFNDTYYLPDKMINENINFDACYVGANKAGRAEYLDRLENIFKKYGLKYNFKLVNNSNEWIKYKDYLKYVFSSKCIVELNLKSQVGLTLRALESVFYQKKLITNNKNIVNFEFYNKNNIFIIDYDNDEDIFDFLSKPYEPVDENIIDYYSFSDWLNRIIESEGEK